VPLKFSPTGLYRFDRFEGWTGARSTVPRVL